MRTASFSDWGGRTWNQRYPTPRYPTPSILYPLPGNPTHTQLNAVPTQIPYPLVTLPPRHPTLKKGHGTRDTPPQRKNMGPEIPFPPRNDIGSGTMEGPYTRQRYPSPSPLNRMTDTWENIYLPVTSLAGGNYSIANPGSQKN